MELGHNFAAKLEPFLLMSKAAKGAAAAKLIQDATSAPGVFVFAELLTLPNIQELGNNETHSKSLSLLQLFSYKTYQDYLTHKDVLPALNAAQTTKLKHLSIVSMASERRILPYADLLTALDMPTVRELEDLIIDAIYLDLLRGKLDQKEAQLEVEYTMGRDLEPDALPLLLAALEDWASTTAAVLATLDDKIGAVNKQAADAKRYREDYDGKVQAVLRDVKEKEASGGGSGSGGKGNSLTGGLGNLVSNTRRMLGGGGDRMDVDFEPPVEGKGKNRKAPQENIKPQRKRNRF